MIPCPNIFRVEKLKMLSFKKNTNAPQVIEENCVDSYHTRTYTYLMIHSIGLYIRGSITTLVVPNDHIFTPTKA